MKKNKKPSKDWFKNLTKGPVPPSLDLNQEVKVTKGKFKGKTGKAIFYKQEGDSGRITLLLNNGKCIYVDSNEVNLKFDSVQITLMMSEEERNYVNELSRQYKEGETHS